MTIPNKLPIARMEDYHTHYLGEAADGRLFWGYGTFTFTRPNTEENWTDSRIDYAILQIFDNEGNYLETKHELEGPQQEASDVSTEERIEEMMNELGAVTYRDIEVKLFQTVIDGIVFGLVVDEESGFINLEPGALIAFYEPWDGEYYT